MAVLTNVAQLQMRFKFLWRGVFRYINADFMPTVENAVWLTNEVMDTFQAQLTGSNAFENAMHTDCTLVDIIGRPRGLHAEVGQTFNRPLNIEGLVTGFPTPSWFTINIFEIPDNANRYVISPPQTIFKPGRMAMPGVAADHINGETLTSAAQVLWGSVAAIISGISEGADPDDSPAFDATLVRKAPTAPFAPLQRANITAFQVARTGHQDTARQ